MTFKKKAFVVRNRTAAQIATEFIVGTFHKFFKEVMKYRTPSKNDAALAYYQNIDFIKKLKNLS